MSPKEAYALYILNDLYGEQIVKLANQWILTGLFTDSLNDLCWEKEPEMYIVGSIFENLVKELNNSPLTRIEATNLIIQKILNQIVNKEIKPEVGGSYVYNYIWSEVEDEYSVQKVPWRQFRVRAHFLLAARNMGLQRWFTNSVLHRLSSCKS